MARLKSDKSGAVKGPARLGAALVRRTGILSTLMLDQIDAEFEAGAPDEFGLWLRFVLAPEEVTRFRDWSRREETQSRDLETRYRLAYQDDELENLLQEVRTVLAMFSRRATERNRIDTGEVC